MRQDKSLQLILATQEDVPAIQNLANQIWPDNYRDILSADQIKYMMDKMYSTTSLSADINNGKKYYLIQQQQQSIGYVCIELNYKSSPILYIHKIYVNPTHQRQGIGNLTITIIEDICKTHGQKTIQLNVNRHNSAKVFYERIGFSVLREEDIDIGNGYWMNDYVMSKKIID